MNIPFLTRFPRLREVGGLLCVIAAVAFATALATYSAADPSWDTATRLHPPHNQMGRVGALLSDLCFQGFGIAAWLFPAMILWLGWRWMRNRELEAPLWRMSGFLAIASTIATAFTLWMPWNPYKGSFEVGGVAGFVLNDILTAWLNPLGASLFLLAVMIVALYLVSTFSLAAALDTAEVRWTAWREKRAEAAEVVDAPVERSKPPRAPAPIVYEAGDAARRAICRRASAHSGGLRSVGGGRHSDPYPGRGRGGTGCRTAAHAARQEEVQEA